ncbi:DUF3231 family protein [Evansella sp. AB-rgal1]|uniref:DUF3231 family protein n=1 Tax=Evansella sp. AB-rgal1 TaxID=3242696 RepID=UPI00359DACB0
MSNEENRLTSAEIGNLWMAYVNNTATICFLKHAIKIVEDDEIKLVIDKGLQLAEDYISSIKTIFQKDNYAVPQGFLDQDVNINAPRLFSDIFHLNFVKSLSKVGIGTYGMCYSMGTRDDVRALFLKCLNTSTDLDEHATKVLLKKGLYVRPPYITVPDKVRFVKKDSFLSGFFTNRRQLTALEITHLFMNLDTNMLGQVVMIGFGQVAEAKELRELFWKGHTIAHSHAQTFSRKLEEDNLPSSSPWDSGVTKSQVAPFSDKLMAFLATFLCAAGIGNYGMALGASPRHDIGAMYSKLMMESGLFANRFAEYLIKNGWMEEPPQSENREELVRGH